MLVHGNPETASIWGPLIDELGRRDVTDVVTLSPPGFGAPLPAEFDATADAYLDWLVQELESLGAPDRPVDVVGHDWGAGHVYRLVADRPDLLRSWAADIGGLLHPDYRWHDAARAWQTPEVGEEIVAAMVQMPIDERRSMYVSLGMTESIAQDCAAAMTEDMGRAILALYRSAPEAQLRALAARLQASQSSDLGRPGAIVHAADDAYVPAELGRSFAAELRAAGADVVDLELADVGHWWMIEAASPAADRLVGFWADRVGLRTD